MRRRQSCQPRIVTALWLAVVACALPPKAICRQIEHGRPVDWTRYAAAMGVRSNDTFGQTLTTVLQNEARYELRWVEAELAIRGVAFTHIVNTPSNYSGHRRGQGVAQSWEAAYWYAQAAQAAWWLWDDLSPQTKRAVAKMVEHDADAFINMTVPYWADKQGHIVTPGAQAAAPPPATSLQTEHTQPAAGYAAGGYSSSARSHSSSGGGSVYQSH